MAQLIRKHFHVVYHLDHLGRLLRSCGLTPQCPQARAKERDDLQPHPQWQVEWLPPYAPELNPQEQVWTYLRFGCLSNFAPDHVEVVSRQVRHETHRTAHRPQLLKNLFRNLRLPFCMPDLDTTYADINNYMARFLSQKSGEISNIPGWISTEFHIQKSVSWKRLAPQRERELQCISCNSLILGDIPNVRYLLDFGRQGAASPAEVWR